MPGRPKTIRSQYRILAPYLYLAPFIVRDFHTLARIYNVKAVNCSTCWGTLKSVWYGSSAHCVFCWFGSLRFLPSAIAARIARKKVVIISGGYDVANVSEIRYGNMCGALSKHLGRALFRMAYIVAAVSQANAREAQKHAKVPRERLRLIYHGFDCHLGMNAPGNHHREKLVLTVGQIDACTIHRKGLLAIAKVSRMLPDVPFVFAGSFEHEAMLILRRTAGSNVTFTGHVSNGDLHELFTRAKIYLQPSIHEAFGCSVAEAMLYNCIPVVSNRYALPEVVGNSGIYVDPDDLQGMASALKHALNNDIHFPESPRERILRKFPLEQRRKLLLRLLDDVFSGS